MISISIIPLGMLVFESISDMIAVEWLLMGTGSLMFTLAFFLIGSKALVDVGNQRLVK